MKTAALLSLVALSITLGFGCVAPADNGASDQEGAAALEPSEHEQSAQSPVKASCPAGQVACLSGNPPCIDPTYEVCCSKSQKWCSDHCQAPGTLCW